MFTFSERAGTMAGCGNPNKLGKIMLRRWKWVIVRYFAEMHGGNKGCSFQRPHEMMEMFAKSGHAQWSSVIRRSKLFRSTLPSAVEIAKSPSCFGVIILSYSKTKFPDRVVSDVNVQQYINKPCSVDFLFAIIESCRLFGEPLVDDFSEALKQ